MKTSFMSIPSTMISGNLKPPVGAGPCAGPNIVLQPVMPSASGGRHLAGSKHSLNALTLNSEKDRYEINADEIKQAYLQHRKENPVQVSQVSAHALLREKGVICFGDVCRLRKSFVDSLKQIEELDEETLQVVSDLIFPETMPSGLNREDQIAWLVNEVNEQQKAYELIFLLGTTAHPSLLEIHYLLRKCKPQVFDVRVSHMLSSFHITPLEQLESLLGVSIQPNVEINLPYEVTLIVGGKAIKFVEKISFSQNGMVKKAYVSPQQEFEIGGELHFFQYGNEVQFHDNGKVYAIRLEKPLKVIAFDEDGKEEVRFRKNDLIYCYDDGKVKSGLLVVSLVVRMANQTFLFVKDHYFELYQSGRIKGGVLSREVSFELQGRWFSFGKSMSLEFYEDGNVHKGTLNSRTPFSIFGNRVLLAAQRIVFHKNGRVKTATTDEEVVLHIPREQKNKNQRKSLWSHIVKWLAKSSQNEKSENTIKLPPRKKMSFYENGMIEKIEEGAGGQKGCDDDVVIRLHNQTSELVLKNGHPNTVTFHKNGQLKQGRLAEDVQIVSQGKVHSLQKNQIIEFDEEGNLIL